MKHDTKGKAEQVKGRGKEVLGIVTGNRALERKGARQRVAGTVEEGLGKAQRKAGELAQGVAKAFDKKTSDKKSRRQEDQRLESEAEEGEQEVATAETRREFRT